jgi:hypothetical protein
LRVWWVSALVLELVVVAVVLPLVLLMVVANGQR